MLHSTLPFWKLMNPVSKEQLRCGPSKKVDLYSGETRCCKYGSEVSNFYMCTMTKPSAQEHIRCAEYDNGAQRKSLSRHTCRNIANRCVSSSLMRKGTLLPCCALFLVVFLNNPFAAQAQLPDPESDLDRCSPNVTGKRRTCEAGLVIPLWPPADASALSTADTAGRAIVFLVAMVYLFLGVSIIADRFMAAIEVITSKEKVVVYTKSDGEEATTTVRVWNETVSNLTLMALGSSAPEIMLSVIEVMRKGFRAGDLGPSTIVGSASFNLFIIIAICMYVIPDDETRKIKHPRVFFITATWSILAYVWLYVILAVSSRGVVEIWEGVLTFLFFPMLVVLAWIADRRLLVYKFMHKKYRMRHKKIIVETEGVNEVNDVQTNGATVLNMEDLGESNCNEDCGALDEHAVRLLDGTEIVDPESNRKMMIQLMRDLRKKHPDADMAELARLASAESLSKQTKSRAFYRIQATRLMTGAGNILNKGKGDPTKSDDTYPSYVDDVDDSVARVYFDPADYKVMENCGFAKLSIVRSGGDLNSTLFVDFNTEDGTANAGSDFVYTEGTVEFKPGETLCTIEIQILDDDIFEEDENFRVRLFNVRSGSSDGMFDDDASDGRKVAIIEQPDFANVVILDDDHAGVFTFGESKQTVSEGVGILKVEVQRNSGARGRVRLPYKTMPGTAKGGGEDYEDAIGELEFENDQTTNRVLVPIVDSNSYHKRTKFRIALGEPYALSKSKGTDAGSDSGINRKEEDETKPITEEEEEARRIAELGKPRLGTNATTEIVIEESYEFKNTVDRLIKKANLAVMVGTSSWREQFKEALSVNGGDEDDGDEEEAEPTCFDYVMHFLTVLWKLLFAFVPPTDYLGGWACFTVSILLIGALTAVIGDVASQFGCVVNLNDAVTAVTLVAMGTSVPDTFASKVAAVGDQYADASIGNVTGSNAVNVFLGIGIAWTLCAIYWAIVGRVPEEKYFRVKPGNLAFSVTVFSVFAIIAVAVLMIRRRFKPIGAELGGPKVYKTISSLIFVMLWLLYIILAALDSYCIIQTF